MNEVMPGIHLPQWPHALLMTLDNRAKEEQWPVATYNCQGSHTQVHCHPIYQASNHTGLTHTPHHTRPNQMAKGLGQGICWEDEGTTQLVAWVPHFVLEVLKGSCTAAGQETGCEFPASHNPSQKRLGKVLFPASVPCIAIISCHMEALRAFGTSGKHERRKPWPWPKPYRAVPNGPVDLITWCAALPVIFKTAWPTWCGLQRRTSWIPCC